MKTAVRTQNPDERSQLERDLTEALENLKAESQGEIERVLGLMSQVVAHRQRTIVTTYPACNAES